MQVRSGTLLRALRTSWINVKAQGLRNGIALFLVAVIITAAFPNGTISAVGPLHLNPALRVLQVVPFVLAMLPVVSLHEFPSAVITLNRRVRAARAMSLALSTVLSMAVIAIGEVIAYQGTSMAATRNFLLLSGITLTTAALLGNIYAWILPVMGFSATLLASINESDWSLYGLLFREYASAPQIVACLGLFSFGVFMCIYHPRGFGYLRTQVGS